MYVCMYETGQHSDRRRCADGVHHQLERVAGPVVDAGEPEEEHPQGSLLDHLQYHSRYIFTYIHTQVNTYNVCVCGMPILECII